MKGRDILSIGDLSRSDIEYILNLTADIKRDYEKGVRKKFCEDKILGLLFQKPSTRTRVSFESAMAQLGGNTIYMRGDELQLKRGEPIKDTARVLDDYLDVIIIRAFDPRDFIEFAQYSKIPVINGLSDREHPTQIICDLFTIQETFDKLSEVKVTWLGDGNNVCNSWLLAAGIMGIDFTAACPNGYTPDKEILKKALKVSEITGATIQVVQNPLHAVSNADVIYTDVWVSMGQKGSEEKMRVFQDFQINTNLLKRAKPTTKVMHCLPAHRGQEIEDDIFEGSQSVILRQSENKFHGAKGILASIL